MFVLMNFLYEALGSSFRMIVIRNQNSDVNNNTNNDNNDIDIGNYEIIMIIILKIIK